MKQIISSTSVVVAGGGGARESVVIKNITATQTVYCEVARFDTTPSTVATSANGFPWVAADGPLSVDIPAGQALFMISPTADQTIMFLRSAG